MNQIDTVRKEMMQALKAHDMVRKNALSMLLSAMKARQIDAGKELTDAECGEVVLKEMKQVKETMEGAPESRTDIKEECLAKLAVYEEFAPKMMDEAEVREHVKKALASLGIDAPTLRDKGRLMKELMPALKGKAEGSLVARVVGEFLK